MSRILKNEYCVGHMELGVPAIKPSHHIMINGYDHQRIHITIRRDGRMLLVNSVHVPHMVREPGVSGY